jgi:pyruvate,orthophosphate dikinase
MQYVFELGEIPAATMARVGQRGRTLDEMKRMGLPVPPGFVVADIASRRFLETGDTPAEAWEQILEVVQRGYRRGGESRPELWVVRASPDDAMPAVLETALYVGVTDDLLPALGNWADSQVAGQCRLGFLKTIARLRGIAGARLAGVAADVVGPVPEESWDRDQLATVCRTYEDLLVAETQRLIPDDLAGQMREAIEGVFASWAAAAAVRYRRMHRIADDLGTALVIHPMLLGQVGPDSGTGVAFSRDPETGAPGVAGVFVPGGHHPRSQLRYGDLGELREVDPEGHGRLAAALARLEAARRDLVRIDFVRERGALWLIEGRRGERTVEAAVRVAVDMVDEERITPEEAILAVEPRLLPGMLHPRLVTPVPDDPIALGGATSPGAAAGKVVVSAAAAIAAAERGEDVILVRREVYSEDLDGVLSAAGLVTSHGGRTSHAALAARAAGTPAVTGVPELVIESHSVRFGSLRIGIGEPITIDGTEGEVYAGRLTIAPPPAASHLERLLAWADRVRRLEVWANADTARAAAAARRAGAEGVGLARTEYMFRGERLAVVRRILLLDDGRERAAALQQLESLQVGDFERLLEAMDGSTVVVRLLDPPVHEFLPSRSDVERQMEARRAAGNSTAELERLGDAIDHWSESNPMLGLRGVRLAVVMPEIYRVQVLAALEAVRRRLDAGGDPRLELVVPLINSAEELHRVRDMIEEEVHSAGRLLELAVGAMIELPRAALMAADLALESDFFSFGTNDLTQTTMGMSRDDAEEAFLRAYLDQGILDADPFQTIDPGGVGALIEMAIKAGRAANPGLEFGVCGEHGGDPVSIRYFHRWGVDYVSCSPPRLPIARLAAAQAALTEPGGDGPE